MRQIVNAFINTISQQTPRSPGRQLLQARTALEAAAHHPVKGGATPTWNTKVGFEHSDRLNFQFRGRNNNSTIETVLNNIVRTK